jgi:phospholipid/cholesterol/gamma-HCH transport system substrate-binding protein
MKSEENKRSVMVGLFILFSLVLFVTGVLILGGQQKRFERTIEVKTVFDDISGLRKGNNVWFSGVKIGTVKDIGFYGQSQVEITMRIERDVQKYIRKNSKVRISSEGFIGNKLLLIEGGSFDSPAIEPNDRLESIAPLDTENMMATLQQNNLNLVEITRDFKEISGQLAKGQGTIGSLLADTTMAQNFKETMANLERISSKTAMASDALNLFASRLNQEGGLVNEMLTDTLVFYQLRTTMALLKESASSTAALTDNLSGVSEKLNSNSNSIGMLLNDENFNAQIRTTMDNLESSSEKLDENLEALQHNFLFRGYFRRKARDEQRGTSRNEGVNQESAVKTER